MPQWSPLLDLVMDAMVRRVVFISVVAISSTFVCYVNIGLGFANSYIMLVLDSIVNDVCMVRHTPPTPDIM